MAAQIELEPATQAIRLEGSNTSFTLMAFTKAFIAELVSRDLLLIRPHHPVDRRGFAKVVETLDTFIDERESTIGPILTQALVRIANQLRPSNTGGYEGFEAALRAQQLTFAKCPNPFYEEIEFPVPKIQARAVVEDLDAQQRDIIERTAQSFVRARTSPE